MNIFVVMIFFLLNQALITAVKASRQTQISGPKRSVLKPNNDQPKDIFIQGEGLNLRSKTTSTKNSTKQQTISKIDNQEDSVPLEEQIETSSPKPKTFSDVINQSSKKMQEQSDKIQQENRSRLISNEDINFRSPRGIISISTNEIKKPTSASKSKNRDFANSTKNSDYKNIATTQNILPSHPTNIKARLNSSKSLAASILDSD